jgi:ubiquinone/menaquinone biosynthesis C-methylase UbiE
MGIPGKKTRSNATRHCKTIMTDYFKQSKKYTVKTQYLTAFLHDFWYIPPDVLLRSVEANIWDLCTFKNPILSIGIGNGEVDKLIFKNYKTIDMGIDLDNSQFNTAQKIGMYKKILKVDASRMPFKDGTYSSVVANSTFEHIEYDTKAVREVSRVLKKNGLFYITVPCAFLPKWILQYEQNLNKETAKDKLDLYNKRANHYRYRTFTQWEKIFKKNNMEVVLHKYYFQKTTAIFFYRMFVLFTKQIGKRELWSWIGQSRLTQFLPKKTMIGILEDYVLKQPFENGFFTDTQEGAMLFMIAKKTK